MADDYRIIDADGHVQEMDEELAEYVGPPFNGMEWHHSYGFWPGLTADGYLRSLRQPGGWVGGGKGPTAQDWLRFLDINAIERTVLYPTQGLTHGFIREPEWGVALARAYNDWIHDRFMRVSPRLLAVALLPVQDIGEAVKELRRCVTELGMPGAVIPAVIHGGRTVAGPEFDPLWAAAEELDVPISTHGGTTLALGLEGIGGNFTLGHLLEHPFAQMRQLGAMVLEGVFERFPRLRYGCLECGIGWVPYFMDRLDEEMERKARYSPRCVRKPSEYVRAGNVFFAAEVGESALPLAIEYVRPDVILWASDYPHERDQRDFSGDIPALIARADVADTVKRQIWADNPTRFYRLDRLPPATGVLRSAALVG